MNHFFRKRKSSCCCLSTKSRLNQSQINAKIKHQCIHNTKYDTNTNTFILIHMLQSILFFCTICFIHTFILSTRIAYNLLLEKFSQVNPQTDKQNYTIRTKGLEKSMCQSSPVCRVNTCLVGKKRKEL